MGSRTFRDMAAYWPTSTDVFAPPMNQIPKMVFSRRAQAILETVRTMAASDDTRGDAIIRPAAEPQPGAVSWAAARMAGGDLAEEIARLKRQEGRPIIAHGGASFARDLVTESSSTGSSCWFIPWCWAGACRSSPDSPRRRRSSS